MPFIFGMLAGETDFTNRTAETEHLMRNFEGGINTILISPRRWGKSSLVAHAGRTLQRKNKNIRVCYLDIYGAKNEAEFYSLYSSAILSAVSNRLDDAVEYSRKFLSRFIPKLSIQPHPDSEISVALDWKEVQKNPEEILNLPESIAKSKNIRMVVCIDEFQNIASFENPLAFQKKLRSIIQKHKHVTYCFYGSKRHMMMDVFTSPSMPFYKFGDIIFLDKIKKTDLVRFVQKRFKDTGKSIDKADAAMVCDLTECHPYYTQQLAQQIWLQTQRKADSAIVMASHERLINQFSFFFQVQSDSLSAPQINYLYAIIMKETKLSGKDVIERYRLGTSANVIKIRQALQEREIIDSLEGYPQILDPYFAEWLKSRYFRNRRF